MIGPRLLTDRLTVLEAGQGLDAYGNEVPAGEWMMTGVVAALVAPAEGTESTDGRQARTVVYEVFSQAPLPASARVRWRRETYEVATPPKLWRGFWVSSIRRVQG